MAKKSKAAARKPRGKINKKLIRKAAAKSKAKASAKPSAKSGAKRPVARGAKSPAKTKPISRRATAGLGLAGSGAANPIAVEVWRGGMVESRHRCAYAILDAAGGIVESQGDIERPIYARSAIKSLQALPLVESGAADRFKLTDKELALACASHNAEPMHVEAVAAWLAKIGCSADDLECGPQLPYHEPSAHRLLANGGAARRIYNNCSGKHSGFLSTARHKGEPTRGYVGFDHPVQNRVTRALSEICGVDLARAPRGIDGCGIPVLGLSLRAFALGLARIADPAKLPAERKAAAGRIFAAIAREPLMFGGTGNFDSEVTKGCGGRFALKTGAEGVYAAILPALGFGIALKADDGAGRAAEVAMGALLVKLKQIVPAERTALARYLVPAVTNWAGSRVGEIRASSAGF